MVPRLAGRFGIVIHSGSGIAGVFVPFECQSGIGLASIWAIRTNKKPVKSSTGTQVIWIAMLTYHVAKCKLMLKFSYHYGGHTES